VAALLIWKLSGYYYSQFFLQKKSRKISVKKFSGNAKQFSFLFFIDGG